MSPDVAKGFSFYNILMIGMVSGGRSSCVNTFLTASKDINESNLVRRTAIVLNDTKSVNLKVQPLLFYYIFTMFFGSSFSIYGNYGEPIDCKLFRCHNIYSFCLYALFIVCLFYIL